MDATSTSPRQCIVALVPHVCAHESVCGRSRRRGRSVGVCDADFQPLRNVPRRHEPEHGHHVRPRRERIVHLCTARAELRCAARALSACDTFSERWSLLRRGWLRERADGCGHAKCAKGCRQKARRAEGRDSEAVEAGAMPGDRWGPPSRTEAPGMVGVVWCGLARLPPGRTSG